MPTEVRMCCSEDSLSEDEIDDEEYQYASCDKDHGRDGNLNVVREASPDDSHDHGDDSSHAEAEGNGAHQILVTSSFVDLEYGHVASGTAHEKE